MLFRFDSRVFECVFVRGLTLEGHLGFPTHVITKGCYFLAFIEIVVLFLHEGRLVAGFPFKFIFIGFVLKGRLFLDFDLDRGEGTSCLGKLCL